MPYLQKKKSKIDSFLTISILLGRNPSQRHENDLKIFKKPKNGVNDFEREIKIQIWGSEAHFPIAK